MPNNFTPNWKRIGLKSMEEGIAYVIKYLFKERKRLLGKSFGSAVFSIGNQMVMIERNKLTYGDHIWRSK